MLALFCRELRDYICSMCYQSAFCILPTAYSHLSNVVIQQLEFGLLYSEPMYNQCIVYAIAFCSTFWIHPWRGFNDYIFKVYSHLSYGMHSDKGIFKGEKITDSKAVELLQSSESIYCISMYMWFI